MNITGIEDRIRGALYGVAVGDALGAPIEFMSEDAILQKHGCVRDMIGGGWLNVRPGEVTDDTQMTLAVAGGILENPEDPIEAIGARFVAWYNCGPKDVGATCSSSISAAITAAKDKRRPRKEDWKRASLYTHEITGGMTGGNGSLMRTVYCGLYYKRTIDAMANAMNISKMTHYDHVAELDCAAYSGAVNRIVLEDDIERRKLITPEIISGTSGGDTRYPYDMLSCLGYKSNPTGYVVDSFATALHCIYTTSTFEDAVIKAVNLGGDADTIGAITGGLAGAIYGYSQIPERWLSKLHSSGATLMDAGYTGIPERWLTKVLNGETTYVDALCDAALNERTED